MTIGTQDVAAWVGKTQTKTVSVRAGINKALRAVLDLEESGELMTQGIHWLLFDEFVAAREVGPDGHPQRGGFLPPVEMPRRMWAGSRIKFYESFDEGHMLTRRSVIASVTPKVGKGGPLVFVTVDHEISGPKGLVIAEQQDIVYMNIQHAAPKPERVEILTEGDSSTVVVPDEVMLFRYSALTSNSHRIHYDLQYTKETELYPDLVVHGPLTATLVMAHLSKATGNKPLREFTFRGVSPLYVGDPIHIEGYDRGEVLEATAKNPGGVVAMKCTAVVDL